MGKKLDDLKLDDTPLTTPLRDAEWYLFSKEIDDILATGKYTWAEATLTGIQQTVEATERVTDGQREAVKHIEGARTSRYEGGRVSRRYEGWRR